MFGALIAAALLLASLAIITTRTQGTVSKGPVPATVSAAQGVTQEPTAKPAEPASVPVVAPSPEPVDDVSSHVAKQRNDALRPAKPARPTMVKAAASAQPAKAPQPTSVAPPPEVPLPSSTDPLDRRK